MDKKKMTKLRADLEAALKPFSDYGVKVCDDRYGMRDASFTVRFYEKNADGTITTRESLDFRQYAVHYGLDPSMLGKKFEKGGHTYQIAGLLTLERMVVTKDETGREVKYPPQTVKQYLGVTV